MITERKKILVAMSGGVDSSVAALLLKKKGYDVSGGFIEGYNVDGCQDKELEDARAVAQHLDIPFYVFDFKEEYEKRVVKYLLDGYRQGITPNPDVVCNSQIKFGLFYERAREAGFDCVASGHYAQIKKSWRGEYKLCAGKDNNKDQSYFLWQVPKQRLAHIIFPLGDILKQNVRAVARKATLPVAEKKDSQGVCFLGKFDFKEFLKEHIKEKKGEIIDINGKTVGEHDGVWFYTLGQRHGIKNTAGVPFYVVRKDLERNRLVVAYEDDAELYARRVQVGDINLLDQKALRLFKKGHSIRVRARIRYRQALKKAIFTPAEYGAVLEFEEKDKLFPASGQSAVLYNNHGQVLGGGVIR